MSTSEEGKEQGIRKTWAEYKRSKDAKLRENLIIYYAPLVKYVAGRISSGLPKSVDIQDLISNGILGLIDAIERFDISRDIKFETYAISRIKGAIIDSLRALDWLPRSLRYRAKEIDKIYADLESSLKRSPTEEELAEALGITLDELRRTLSELSYSSVVALEDVLVMDQSKDSQFFVKDFIIDKKSIDPLELFEDAELKEIVLDAIRSLPEREKKVIVFYYYEGLTLKEIGSLLGVSESRVSQIHSKAILRLKSKIKGSIAV